MDNPKMTICNAFSPHLKSYIPQPPSGAPGSAERPQPERRYLPRTRL
jgi:hypothetical protein